MVDTVDSKSAARKGVRVQVPPGVQKQMEQHRIDSVLFFLHNTILNVTQRYYQQKPLCNGHSLYSLF